VFVSYEDGTSRSTTFQTTLDGQLPDKQTRKTSKTVIVSVFMCKLKALTNSRGWYPLADMVTSDITLDNYIVMSRAVNSTVRVIQKLTVYCA